MPRQRSCCPGNRPAADAGAGRHGLDAARREELASRPVQDRVVAVHVAQVDPGAHDVAELHASAMQQFFCQTEHAERLLMGVAARTAESGRVKAALVADDSRAGRARSRTAIGSHPQRRAVRHDRLHRHLEAGPLIERGLLDLERGGTVVRRAAGREHPATRLAHGLDVCRQVPQEDRLDDDRPEACHPRLRARRGSRDK